MEVGQEDGTGGAVAKAVRTAEVAKEVARVATKKAEKAAEEALQVARRELKRLGKIVDLRRMEARKKTMSSYFLSSRGSGAGQPLSMVLDSSMPDVPGAKPPEHDEYWSGDNEDREIARGQSTLVLGDFLKNIGSSSGSSNTIVISAKSPLIALSEDSEEPSLEETSVF